MEPLLILTYVGIGLLTGFMSGMFGIGGGSVRIPLLVLTGMPLLSAFATNMFTIPFSSLTGAIVQRENIFWRGAKPFVFGATIAIVIATFLTGVFSSKVLALIFFFAALLTVFGLYLDRINHKLYDKLKPTGINLFFGAFFGNLVIGLRGGSGGSLFPPILRSLHVEMHHAIATSLFTSLITSIFALSIYLFRGDVIFIPALIVAGTNVLGSYLGSKLSMKTESKWLKAGLAIIVFVLAFSVVYSEFF